MAITLQTIIEHKREEVAQLKEVRSLSEVQESADASPRPRNFFGAVVNGHTRGSTSVIAEIKRKSPSAGLLRNEFDPVNIAKAYEKAGAAAISCLTDVTFFGGNIEFISKLCHKVIVMVEGAVLVEGQIEEIKKNEQVIEAYLGRSGAV